MTLNQLIELLSKSGVNSKGQVLDFLKSNDAYGLEILAQSIQEKVNKITKEATKWQLKRS